MGENNVGIKTNEARVDYFNVYPNPSNGIFTIGFSSKKETTGTIVITNIAGQTVYETQQIVTYGVNRYNLTFSHLPKGIYFLSLTVEGNKALVKKLIIE